MLLQNFGKFSQYWSEVLNDKYFIDSNSNFGGASFDQNWNYWVTELATIMVVAIHSIVWLLNWPIYQRWQWCRQWLLSKLKSNCCNVRIWKHDDVHFIDVLLAICLFSIQCWLRSLKGKKRHTLYICSDIVDSIWAWSYGYW